MKLVIAGGGGFRVPQVLRALTRAPFLDDITLYDIDPARLEVMRAVAEQFGLNLPITTQTDLHRAVSGANFVFSAMRIGGTCGRVTDERVALERGVLGQETVGVGGYAYALRTIGPALDLAGAVHEANPDAWIINFTNPAGIITQAMRTVHPNSVGICDTPIGLVRKVCRILGVDEAEASYDYVGLNHLGWLRTLRVDGRDLLPSFIASPELSCLEEARIIGEDWVRCLGMLPNEYLFYYYSARESLAAVSEGETRGEFLHRQQAGFYASAEADLSRAGQLWTRAHHEREETYMAEARSGEERAEEDMGGGYENVALDLMTALATGQPARMILGVPNEQMIPALGPDAIIEVPTRVDASGLHPQPPGPLDGPELGLVTSVKACEELIIDAALSSSRELAWRALATHPLVDSTRVARRILAEYEKRHGLFD
ncbi:MAG: 6-phospho-beta-glucosidase [Flaviflexus sp.]|nr:6-phospho-beta-glucosidase [Flaviflexus sp.]